MKHTYILSAGLAAALLLFSTTAHAARDYCREYTRTIRVDGRAQIGYGTACRQPDGAWQIISTRGNVDITSHIYDSIRRRDRHAVIIPAYRGRGHHYSHHRRHDRKRRHSQHNHGTSLYFKF